MSASGFAFGTEEPFEGDAAEEQPVIGAIGLIKGAVAVGALAFAVFSLAPGLDLAIARLFYAGNGQFIGNQLAFFGMLRFAFNGLFYLTCGVTAVGLLITAGRPQNGWASAYGNGSLLPFAS
jgi:lipid A 4'-phosphatase